MPDKPTPSRPRSLIRRWRVPAHYLQGAERFEGAGVLEDFPGSLGLLLWQCERDVRLWAVSTTVEREHLFSSTAAARCVAAVEAVGSGAREVAPAIRALAGMLEHPLDVNGEVVTLACQRISQWAEARGASSTALTFAQAAALAQPAAPACAYRVGRLARRVGDFGRAEGWLNRAIVLARQSKDWDTYAVAYSGLGNVNFARGNLPAAERCHRKALRIAGHYGMPSRSAEVLHDLFILHCETGSEEASSAAREALVLYPSDHPGRIALVQDVAQSWVLNGQFSAALPVLTALIDRVLPHQRGVVAANAARAAGALGDRARFEICWHLAMDAIENGGPSDVQAAALLDLARGAASLGNPELASAAGERSLLIARRQKAHKLVFEAEAVLEGLASEAAALHPPAVSSSPEVVALSEEMIRSLHRPATAGV